MPRKLKDADGLTFAEGRFANFLAHGLSQVEAFRKSWPKTRATAASMHERACRLANQPAIRSRVREILGQMKLSDLDNGPQAFKDLLAALERANAASNFTAVAQLSRLRLDCLGMLKSSVGDRTGFNTISDANLLEKLAGTNAGLRKELEKILGAESFEQAKPAAAEPAAPIPTVPSTPTKH
jgi:hypothetical protein